MSLRLRLVVAIGLVALAALVAADVATYSSLRTFMFDRVDQTLLATHQAFSPPPGAQAIGPGNDEGGPVFHTVPPSRFGALAPGFFVERITPVGIFRQDATEPGGRHYAPTLPAWATAPLGADAVEQPSTGNDYFTTSSTVSGGPSFRVLVTTTPDGDRLILAQPLDATTETLHDLLLIELAVTAAALLAAVLLGFWLVRVGLQPLQEIEDTAEAIAEGRLESRVPGEEKRTEVGRLARSLNQMLARIQRAFAERDATEAQLRQSEERMRRFVADASHELRTPLAAVSAYAELYQRAAAEHPEDVGRLMAGIEGESARMRTLVEDLFLLARLDEGRPLAQVPVELVGLAADAVNAAVAVGPAWPVTLSAAGPVEVVGDGERLRQVLDNLLSNVRAHTPAGTPTTVTVSTDGASAVVEVADRGPGISPQDGARVFERFYRADPSRARNSGGSGLGLSIVAAIVAAHHGQVAAAPGPEGGVTFTVRLPVAAVDPEAPPPAASNGRPPQAAPAPAVRAG